MAASLKLRAVKTEGRLKFTAEKTYRAYVKTLGDGEEREVTIRPVPKRQGPQTMRFYRGVVVPDIAEASGITDPDEYEAVHQALAWKFLKMANHPLFDYPRRRSTSKDDMDQGEMSEYVTKCIDWAETSIPGCRVRRPDEIDDWNAIPEYDWSN